VASGQKTTGDARDRGGDLMAVQSFKELHAWQRAMDFVEQVYRVSATFPAEERYGLTAQIRRSAISVPSNIAEGQGRHGTKDFLYFLSISYGSLCEVQTQLLIAKRLSYLNTPHESSLTDLSNEVGRLINGLMRSLRNCRSGP
jgi:four helix bundle protein